MLCFTRVESDALEIDHATSMLELQSLLLQLCFPQGMKALILPLHACASSENFKNFIGLMMYEVSFIPSFEKASQYDFSAFLEKIKRLNVPKMPYEREKEFRQALHAVMGELHLYGWAHTLGLDRLVTHEVIRTLQKLDAASVFQELILMVSSSEEVPAVDPTLWEKIKKACIGMLTKLVSPKRRAQIHAYVQQKLQKASSSQVPIISNVITQIHK
jgi:hypothetical protein